MNMATFGARLLRWKASAWFVAAEIIGAVLALVGFAISVVALFQAIAAANESRVVNAWAILSTQAPGNSGKVEAVEALVARGIVLDGIDLSCLTMAGPQDEMPVIVWPETDEDIERALGRDVSRATDLNCDPPTYLHGLDLTQGDAPASIRRADLSGTNLTEANLSGANMRSTSFRNANLSRTVTADTDFFLADLTYVDGAPDLSEADLHLASLAHSTIGRLNLRWDEGLPSGVYGATVYNLHLEFDPEPTQIWYEDAGGYVSLAEADIWSIHAADVHLPLLGLDGVIIREGTFEGAQAHYSYESPEPGAGWTLAEIQDATFQDVSFRDADLSGMTFKNSRCIRCDFTGANLIETVFDQVEMTGSTFCDDTGCATGLTTAQTSGMFVLGSADDADASITDMFYRREFISNSEQVVTQRALDDDDVALRVCQDTRLSDISDRELATYDMLQLRVALMKLTCTP